MKKVSKKSFVVMGFSLLLIIIGLILIFTGNNNSLTEKKKDPSENIDDFTKPMIKVFTKSDVMSLIYQFKAMENINEDWYVSDTALIAHNSDNTKYLARYKKVLPNGKTEEYEIIISNEENGYTIELPGWKIDEKKLDEFDFIYYREGEEGYDPVNQQYSQESSGWNASDWEYVPDNSWQANQSLE